MNLDMSNEDVEAIYYNLGLIVNEKKEKISYFKKAIDMFSTITLEGLNIKGPVVNVVAALVYYHLGLLLTEEERIECFKQPIGIYEKYNYDSENATFIYYNLGLLSTQEVICLGDPYILFRIDVSWFIFKTYRRKWKTDLFMSICLYRSGGRID